MADTFIWRMDGTAHKSSVDRLRQEIIHAHTSQTPLAISIILNALPVESPQSGAAVKRGAFKITGKQFENVGSKELRMQFSDPALKDFTVTIPKRISGAIDSTTPALRISFDSLLLADIPRLAELGINRSRFQRVTGFELSAATSVTFLADDLNPDRLTWIDVALTDAAHRASTAATLMELAMMAPQLARCPEVGEVMPVALRADDPCCGDEEEKIWYVGRRHGTEGQRLCEIACHKFIVGGQVAYDNVWGPDTKKGCNDYEALNCPGGLC
ncbi:MAG: hypothetical protein ACK47B_06885 [Armatimonadota bacterium]